MPQIWKIFSRDFMRLARTPKTWVILIGMLVMPALYSWVNISAFWDPYSATGNINVAVVNEDQGASTPQTGTVNVGNQVVAQLRENTQIGWVFMDATEADAALHVGRVYASVTIPETFSADLLSIMSDSYTKPTLEYRVNEKRNAIAPIITDTASRELSHQISSAFQQQIAGIVATTVKENSTDITDKLAHAQRVGTESFNAATQKIRDTQTQLNDLDTKLSAAASSISGAKTTITQVEQAINDSQDALNDVQTLSSQAQRSIANYTDLTTAAFVEASSAAAQASSQARLAVSNINGVLGTAGEQISAAGEQVDVALKDTSDALTTAEEILNGTQLTPELHTQLQSKIDTLKADHERTSQLRADLANLHTSTASSAQTIEKLADDVDAATTTTAATADTLRSTVSSSLPALNTALGDLHFAAGSLSASLEGQKTTLTQARALADDVSAQVLATQSVLATLTTDLDSLISGVDTVKNDLNALNSVAQSQVLSTSTGIDPTRIGQFFASPVQVSSVPVFPVGTYGNAMAALFTNLSLWIGAFVLMVIFRLEVDLDGLSQVTITQAYIGRLLLFVPIVAAQALTVTIGNLILGVDVTHPLAYVAACVVIGVVYLSIMYALASAFGHIGRGVAILIVILQIPGATGIYPIEMMSGFFQAIYPILPFSYGIDATRETIGGFYGHHFAGAMAILVFMGTAAFLLGLIIRRGLGHVHTLMKNELVTSSLVAAEPSFISGRGYRVADVIRVIQGRDDYAASVEQRVRTIGRRMRVTVYAGVAGLLGLSVLAAQAPQQKVLFLGLWTGWAVIVFVAVAAMEYVRQSLIQSADLLHLSDEELRAQIVARNLPFTGSTLQEGTPTRAVDTGEDSRGTQAREGENDPPLRSQATSSDLENTADEDRHKENSPGVDSPPDAHPGTKGDNAGEETAAQPHATILNAAFPTEAPESQTSVKEPGE